MDEDDQNFIVDYVFDDDEQDEIPVCVCPNCGNDDDDKIVDHD